jgi:uncharacterized protein YdeI (YjbR/CyaY-like superfamily)
MKVMETAERIHPDTPAEWGAWLSRVGDRTEGVWLVLWRRGSGHEVISYEDAILEALAVGWIDGQSKPWDDERSLLWFTRRRPRSPWSRVNKERVARLEREGRMLPAGREAVELAKALGTWTVLDEADRLVEPAELSARLDATPAARRHWDAFPPSVRRVALGGIALAKRPETKQRRIDRIVDLATRNVRPA